MVKASIRKVDGVPVDEREMNDEEELERIR
jgi:hypothetical protein